MTTRKLLLTVLGVLSCKCAFGADVVVIGRMILNEPMSYVKDECSDGDLCMHRWWKSVIQIDKTVQGPPLSGRITAAVSQHIGMNPRYMNAIRLVILTPIDDPEQRKKLKADYYLKEASPPESSMFCSSYDPADIGLKTEQTYVSRSAGDPIYCFELK